MSKWHGHHIPAVSVIDSNQLHTSVLHTKCNFINLHASIHINIHVYVWTYFNFTAPSIWKIQRKRQNTDWILKQLLEEKEKRNRKKRTPVLEFLKNIRIKNFLLQMWNSMSRISLLKRCWAISQFFFLNGKNEKIWIYLHYTHFT